VGKIEKERKKERKKEGMKERKRERKKNAILRKSERERK